jgi:hypothetical protein
MKKNLEDIYLNGKYKSFKSKINIWVMLEGYIYLFYRKLYVWGIILLGIDIVLYLFKLYFIMVILNIILGFVFNKLYLRIVDDRINNYKLQHWDNKDVIREVKKGSSSINSGLIMGFITIVLIIISCIDFNSYEVTMGSIYFKLDNSWIEGEYNNDYYSSFEYMDDDNDCSITVEVINSLGEEEFIKNMLESYEVDSETESIKINKYNYKMVNIDKDGVNSNIYTINRNNYLYVVMFDTYKDNGICNNYQNDFINEVRFKN